MKNYVQGQKRRKLILQNAGTRVRLLYILRVNFSYLFQAIRQWDQALRERNDYRDALAKVQRQHEEAVKEINQAMAVRIKVSWRTRRRTTNITRNTQRY